VIVFAPSTDPLEGLRAVTTGISSNMKLGLTTGSVLDDAGDANSIWKWPIWCAGM